MKDKIVAIRFSKAELEKIKKYIRIKAVKEDRDISITDFIREALGHEFNFADEEKI